MLESVIVANQIIDEVTHKINQCIVFKVNF